MGLWDQGHLVRQDAAYEAEPVRWGTGDGGRGERGGFLGGVPDQGRLEAAGRTAYLRGPMVSAARRWRGREGRTLFLWGFMQAAFALGFTPWRLARFYRAAGS